MARDWASMRVLPWKNPSWRSLLPKLGSVGVMLWLWLMVKGEVREVGIACIEGENKRGGIFRGCER